MKRLLAILVIALAAAATAHADSPRAVYNFNPDWKVFVGDPKGAEAPAFDDAAWKTVATPYAWNEDEAFHVAIADLPTGIAWYRKHFKLPADAAGKKVFLEFQGVRFAGEFWVNGKNVGLHENGITACGLDVTDAVRAPGEENVVAVRTDNSWRYRERATNSTYQWNDRNFNTNYGGINKNVRLHVADKLYQTLPLFANLGTTGVYVYASDIDVAKRSATITAESQVRNEHDGPRTFDYHVAIQDMEGRTVAEFDGKPTTLAAGETNTVSASRRVDDLHLWSWGYGYLYNVVTTLRVDGIPVDSVTTRTGFRKTEFAHGVFKLNDRVLHLKGYGQRTTNEWPGVGIDLPPWISDFSNSMIVAGNGNLVRWMHVTPSKQDVESCDRVGLLQAMPAGDSEGDVTGRRWEQRVEVMRDSIIYNRNNPSVIFYESGNKGITDAHMAEMKAVRDQYDAHGGRAIGAREMLASNVAEWGGEMLYINKSATKPLWMTEYSRDEGLRKWWDELSPPFHADGSGDGQGAVYNRNQDSHAIEDVVRWYDYWRERPGTGRRVNAGGVNIIFSDTNTHFRGSENYRRSGEVDAVRLPKDGYFAHKVMWDGWVDVERPSVCLLGHWNYAPGTKKNAYAVSSGDKVELLLNGKSLGFGKQSSRFLFTFPDVAWEPGALTAVAYDAAGVKVGEAMKHTAGEPHALRLTPHVGPGGLRADRADLALVDVEVVDDHGERCPTALNEVTFALDGPVEWRGGIAQGPDNYILAKTLPVECGVNRVLIRAGAEPGTITVNASSPGLQSAKIELKSHAAPSTDGLATARGDEDPPSYLDRGPTPPGDSVTPTRTPVEIAKATAGANAEQAAQSYDDNEASSWSNGGDLTRGWIRYELARPADVSQITMKLADWRNRSYPVRILVDDKEDFRGDTERSLGYVTLTFPPTHGKSVRVELIGATTEGDAFAGIVEVAEEKQASEKQPGAQAEPDTNTPPSDPSPRRGSSNLAIVEIEIYEPLAK